MILEIQPMKLFLTEDIHAFTFGRWGGKGKVDIYGKKKYVVKP